MPNHDMPEVVEPDSSGLQTSDTSEPAEPSDQISEELLEQYLRDLANYTELATRTETVTQNPNFAGVAGSIYSGSTEEQLEISGQASSMASPVFTPMPSPGGTGGRGY